jgi:hypothetical protein
LSYVHYIYFTSEKQYDIVKPSKRSPAGPKETSSRFQIPAVNAQIFPNSKEDFIMKMIRTFLMEYYKTFAASYQK